jgi:hypothetical protein
MKHAPTLTATHVLAILVLVAVVLHPDIAFAADDDWAEKFVTFIDKLRSSGAKLIIALGGLGLTAYFGIGALSGNVPWQRVGYAVVGTLGALFLPDALKLIIEGLS